MNIVPVKARVREPQEVVYFTHGPVVLPSKGKPGGHCIKGDVIVKFNQNLPQEIPVSVWNGVNGIVIKAEEWRFDLLFVPSASLMVSPKQDSILFYRTQPLVPDAIANKDGFLEIRFRDEQVCNSVVCKWRNTIRMVTQSLFILPEPSRQYPVLEPITRSLSGHFLCGAYCLLSMWHQEEGPGMHPEYDLLWVELIFEEARRRVLFKFYDSCDPSAKRRGRLELPELYESHDTDHSNYNLVGQTITVHSHWPTAGRKHINYSVILPQWVIAFRTRVEARLFLDMAESARETGRGLADAPQRRLDILAEYAEDRKLGYYDSPLLTNRSDSFDFPVPAMQRDDPGPVVTNHRGGAVMFNNKGPPPPVRSDYQRAGEGKVPCASKGPQIAPANSGDHQRVAEGKIPCASKGPQVVPTSSAVCNVLKEWDSINTHSAEQRHGGAHISSAPTASQFAHSVDQRHGGSAPGREGGQRNVSDPRCGGAPTSSAVAGRERAHPNVADLRQGVAQTSSPPSAKTLAQKNLLDPRTARAQMTSVLSVRPVPTTSNSDKRGGEGQMSSVMAPETARTHTADRGDSGGQISSVSKGREVARTADRGDSGGQISSVSKGREFAHTNSAERGHGGRQILNAPKGREISRSNSDDRRDSGGHISTHTNSGERGHGGRRAHKEREKSRSNSGERGHGGRRAHKRAEKSRSNSDERGHGGRRAHKGGDKSRSNSDERRHGGRRAHKGRKNSRSTSDERRHGKLQILGAPKRPELSPSNSDDRGRHAPRKSQGRQISRSNSPEDQSEESSSNSDVETQEPDANCRRLMAAFKGPEPTKADEREKESQKKDKKKTNSATVPETKKDGHREDAAKKKAAEKRRDVSDEEAESDDDAGSGCGNIFATENDSSYAFNDLGWTDSESGHSNSS